MKDITHNSMPATLYGPTIQAKNDAAARALQAHLKLPLPTKFGALAACSKSRIGS